VKKLLIGLVLSILSLAASQKICEAQAIVTVSSTGQIPNHFKTYTLFLICNPDWLAPAANQDLSNLYLGFERFGRAIGDENAAVWFWKNVGAPKVPAYAAFVDVERSVRFCQAWKLTPTSGPHIVFLEKYPDEKHLGSSLPKNRAVFELGAMDKTQISALLGKLTDQLVLTGAVATPTPPGRSTTASGDASSPPPAKPVQLSPLARLIEAVRQDLNGFGCSWTFKVDAGPASADLHACQGG
jgi:hypothetical protein